MNQKANELLRKRKCHNQKHAPLSPPRVLSDTCWDRVRERTVLFGFQACSQRLKKVDYCQQQTALEHHSIKELKVSIKEKSLHIPPSSWREAGGLCPKDWRAFSHARLDDYNRSPLSSTQPFHFDKSNFESIF